MLKLALALVGKDLKLLLTRGRGLAQGLLLGLVLLFLFSLSRETGELIPPREAATIFWLGTIFCQVLIFNQLYALEEQNGARQGLVMSPLPAQGIWLGKAITAFFLLLLAQLVFFPATIIFLGQTLAGAWLPGAAMLLLTDVGICAIGSLLGALGQGQGNRESLLSIILFPLLIPLLLAAITISGHCLGDAEVDMQAWLGIIGAFDAIFIASSLLLFGFLYQGGE